jgi:hypothetical protein
VRDWPSALQDSKRRKFFLLESREVSYFWQPSMTKIS